MSLSIAPSVFSPSDAQAARKAIRPAAPETISDVIGRAADVKRNPEATTPAPLPPASKDFGRGGISFFA
jgi:hypothetical protein